MSEHEDKQITYQLKGADVILSYLRDAGYVIIRDRTDPEGGIPGRS